MFKSAWMAVWASKGRLPLLFCLFENAFLWGKKRLCYSSIFKVGLTCDLWGNAAVRIGDERKPQVNVM